MNIASEGSVYRRLYISATLDRVMISTYFIILYGLQCMDSPFTNSQCIVARRVVDH